MGNSRVYVFVEERRFRHNEDAVIQHASLKATADNTFTVKLPTEKKYTVTLNGKEVSAKTDSKGLITVEMKVQDLLEIK